jgi:ferric-dicitrate binding protein FerR (iron transport regulator)
MESKLQYNSSFTRKVRLTGDGYFEVAHNPDRPFSVELDGGGTVEVLGTEFHISQTGNNTSVLVKSGKVRFSPADGDYPVLTASQKAVFSKKTRR